LFLFDYCLNTGSIKRENVVPKGVTPEIEVKKRKI